MRKLLLNTTPLFRKLRQLSLLLTLLLALPQTAWGQTTYDKGTYNSENNTWGNWQVAASNTTVSSSGDNYLSFNVLDNTTATITLTLTNPGNTSEKICRAYFSYNQDSSIPDDNKVKLLSAKIVDTNNSESDLTNDFNKAIKSCTFNAKTPVEWSTGDKFVVTLQVHNTTGATTNHSIQAAELKTGTPYGLIVNGITVTNVNQNSVTNKEKYFDEQQHNVDEAVFTPEEGSNPATLTLTLADFDVSSANIAAIESSLGNLKVILAGANTITCGNNKAFNLAANSTLNFTTNGTNSGQLTISSTSSITTESFYSPSTATVTYTGLVASNPTSTSVLISPLTSYDITIAGIAVTNANASAITGTGITGTVSYDATTNTLTLKNAEITGPVFYSGTTTLNFALDGTNSIINTGGTYAIGTSNYTNGLLNFAKATGASSAELTLTRGASGDYPISAGTPTLGSGLYWKRTAATTLVITEDPNFVILDGLVIADGSTINGTSGSITYNASDKTLTLNGYEKDFGANHAIKTGVSGLKVKLIGASTINCSADSAVFHAFSSSASIQFIKDDATSKLTMTGTDFNNFATNSITYDGFIYYSSQTTKGITQAAAPQLGKLTKVDAGSYYTFATIDYADSDKSGSDAIYKDASPVLKYSFDYADSQKQDVSDQTYPAEGIKMTDPGILTAWVEVGTYKGPEAKGVRFGFIENPIEMEFNGTSKEISITPAPTMTNPVTYSVRSDSQSDFDDFAVLNATNNKITINNCYSGKIGFTFSNTDGGYTSLNDSTNITFNVLPSKPTLSLESGLYYPGQQITATPTVPDAAYNSYFKINGNTEAGYTQPYTYTFNSAGVFNVSTVTYFVRGGNTSPLFGEYVEAKIIINTKPILNALVGNTEQYVEGQGQAGDIYIDIRGDLNNSDPLTLETGCKLYYYIGSDKSKAVEYDPSNHIRLTESNTVTAFIVYTDPTDATIVYESEPVSASYTVNQQMADPFGADLNYKTCYLDKDYSLKKPNGMKVLIITGVSGNSVTTSAIDYIPSRKPVLLEKEGAATNGYYNAETYTGTEVNLSSNLLKYTGTNTSVNTTGKEYILYKNEFVKATGEISAGRCYLDLSGTNLPARGVFGIGNDGSTAIEGIDVEATEDEEWYDLQGRRIQKPTKAGIYIKNGKKIVVNNK